MKKIIVSACLLGTNCKYNGGNNYNQELIEHLKNFEIIPICPECFGGLSTPRVPSEIIEEKVINKEGIDVTNNYLSGAKKALELAKSNNIKVAILKAKSPSCGEGKIYDGTFTNTLIDGDGITVRMFKDEGIKVYTENNYKENLKDLVG